MANHQRRSELQISDAAGMFRQASISFRASITLFLTLALLSSIHDTALERSSWLSGFTSSAQNATFSIHLSMDQKHQTAMAPYKGQNASSGFYNYEAIDSIISRLVSAFFPLEDISIGDSSEGSSTEVINRDRDGDFSKGPASEETSSGREDVHSTDLDETASQSLDTQQADSQGHVQNDQVLIRSGDELERSELGDELERSELNEVQKPDGEALPSVGDSDVVKPFRAHTEEDWSFLDDINEESDEADSDIGFPRLKIETVSNYTKALPQETIIDASELSLFTGKLLGGRGLDQGAYPHGGMTLLLLLLLLATALVVFLAIIGFQHVIVLGSVVHSVVSTHMGKRLNPVRVIKSSMKSNVARLIWLVFLYASLRGFENIFLMKTLFGGMMEVEQIEELVLRLSSTTFPFLAPFTDVDATNFAMAVRIGIYVGVDYVFDGIIYCIYIIACWDTIMERSNWFTGAISKSCILIKTLQPQALVIRVVETMLCGRSFRWILQRGIGEFGAGFVISTVQVYFLVLWLIFYISARSIHDRSNFSYRNLEDFLDRFK